MIKNANQTSSQDGGIGRYSVPPRTTKRRTTTNLKTKSNQNCQKIELYGSLTTKELKKKHSSRLVGGVETQLEWKGLPASQWLVDWVRQQLADRMVPHFHADKLGGTTGE